MDEPFLIMDGCTAGKFPEGTWWGQIFRGSPRFLEDIASFFLKAICLRFHGSHLKFWSISTDVFPADLQASCWCCAASSSGASSFWWPGRAVATGPATAVGPSCSAAMGAGSKGCRIRSGPSCWWNKWLGGGNMCHPSQAGSVRNFPLWYEPTYSNRCFDDSFHDPWILGMGCLFWELVLHHHWCYMGSRFSHLRVLPPGFMSLSLGVSFFAYLISLAEHTYQPKKRLSAGRNWKKMEGRTCRRKSFRQKHRVSFWKLTALMPQVFKNKIIG